MARLAAAGGAAGVADHERTAVTIPAGRVWLLLGALLVLEIKGEPL